MSGEIEGGNEMESLAGKSPDRQLLRASDFPGVKPGAKGSPGNLGQIGESVAAFQGGQKVRF